jgi:hypothetical protein
LYGLAEVPKCDFFCNVYSSFEYFAIFFMQRQISS